MSAFVNVGSNGGADQMPRRVVSEARYLYGSRLTCRSDVFMDNVNREISMEMMVGLRHSGNLYLLMFLIDQICARVPWQAIYPHNSSVNEQSLPYRLGCQSEQVRLSFPIILDFFC